MKLVKFNLEYGAFPIWIYDEVGNFLMNDIPPEILEDSDICRELIAIQNDYNNLFIDDSLVFEYVGFQDEKDEKNFNDRVKKVISELKEFLEKKYRISAIVIGGISYEEAEL